LRQTRQHHIRDRDAFFFMKPHRVFPLLAALALTSIPSVSVAAPDKPAAPKLTKAPTLVKFVEAKYPEDEQKAGKSASVVVKVAISATGTVDAVEVATSAGAAFDAAALEAVKQFVFEPAEIDGKPAPIRILYKYEFVLKTEAPTLAVFEGTVRARKTKAPIASITVELDTGQRAITDASGKFKIEDVKSGLHAISLSGENVTAVRTEETFAEGKRLEATYEIENQPEAVAPGEEADLEIVVVAPPVRKEVVSTAIAADQGRKVAGTQGDVLKVVENMPGVGRATVGSGQLVVWGAAPQDTRVYVDGVRVPSLYHHGGIRSVIHPELVKSVALAPGGWGAAFGRSLGGLVTVEQRALDGDGFHGAAQLDVFDASMAIKAAITKNVHAAIAGRRGHLDSLIPLVTKRDTGVLFTVPQYWDGQARLAWTPSARTTVELGGMLSSDTTERVVASVDPGSRRSEARTVQWGRIYGRYQQQGENGAVVTVNPWVGIDSTSLVTRNGNTPADLQVDSTLLGLRASHRSRPLERLTIEVGLDAEATFATAKRRGSISAPAREGDIRVFAQAPSDQTSADSWQATVASAAVFVDGDLSLLDGKVHVFPGARFEPYLISASRRTPVVGETPSIGAFTNEISISPRLALTAEMGPRVRGRLAYGYYEQPPAPEDMSAVFGNPLLGLSRAHHALAGAKISLLETLSVEVTGFFTSSTGLAARNPSTAPLLAEALLPIGEGRAFGAQFLLRKELARGFFGWIAYGIVRSERRDRPDAPFRLFDLDQTHVLTALASYTIGRGFEIGARGRFSSGFPRTPVISAAYDARTDAYHPTFGPQNAERIPAFIQFDLRASKTFKIGKSELEVYLDIQNVTNRQNPEEIVYTQDFSRRGYITGLPILPSLGARFTW
jgi:TonB family protein